MASANMTIGNANAVVVSAQNLGTSPDQSSKSSGISGLLLFPFKFNGKPAFTSIAEADS